MLVLQQVFSLVKKRLFLQLDPTNSELLLVFLLSVALTLLVFFIFFLAQFKQFPPNKYVIHIRGGKIIRVMVGGRLIKIPFLDKIYVLPKNVQQTEFEVTERFNLTIKVLWQIEKPLDVLANTNIPYNSIGINLKEKGETLLSEQYLLFPYPQEFIQNKERILRELKAALIQKTDSWGITITDIVGKMA